MKIPKNAPSPGPALETSTTKPAAITPPVVMSAAASYAGITPKPPAYDPDAAAIFLKAFRPRLDAIASADLLVPRLDIRAAGLAALGVAPAWAVCVEVGGAHSGVVRGAKNMFGNLGGALSSLVIGFALERFGSWQAPLLSVAALYVVAALLWLAIDPAKRIVVDEPAAPISAAAGMGS
jgi:hypothetical protein